MVHFMLFSPKFLKGPKFQTRVLHVPSRETRPMRRLATPTRIRSIHPRPTANAMGARASYSRVLIGEGLITRRNYRSARGMTLFLHPVLSRPSDRVLE